ncbi:DUF3365 domain-containing protein [Flavihumibacter stibioxidans]|uniref:Tll0287-like domain-containing protein n=1 Tax=Flavihumibacter stibioxidans TaxID=1834163 RepID=A0ABR7M400_9BACT|nr:DUF3365 domain-containing protein [Flavihumibacter stibioxidans]MBC6489753.1 hypothetical protein [Flavihumibacter stibioxidans]
MKAIHAITGFICIMVAGCASQPESETVKPDYLKLGDSIAAASFDNLRTALQASVAKDGPEKSIGFCHDNAMALTGKLDSDSIHVYRVAERYRNPANQLKPGDQVAWQQYVTAKSKGDSIFSTITESDSAVDYYKPILLQPMCATCHGQPITNIPESLVRVIDSVYPGDLAKGFAPGDLRGMWHIRFIKPKS